MICHCVSKICFVYFCLIEPIFQSEIEVHYLAHNSLEIKCENKKPKIVWNGEHGTFSAEITYNGETLSKNKTECSFQFPDLYYLTTYKIKVPKSHLISISICHSCMPKSYVLELLFM